MSSEQPKLSNSEDENKSTADEQSTAPQTPTVAMETQSAASLADVDDSDEPRPDVDFGQLLDQFEQEQATLQEGEVVRGTVV